MKDTIHLTNQRSSLLDLLAITDVTGRRVVLQPAGSPGDRRECFADTEDHPHVQTMLRVNWLRIERGHAPELLDGPTVPPPAPATTSVPPVETAAPPSVPPPQEAQAEAPEPEAPIESPEAAAEHRRSKNKR